MHGDLTNPLTFTYILNPPKIPELIQQPNVNPDVERLDIIQDDPALTIDDLGLTDDQLDEQIEELDLFYLAQYFGAWTKYAGNPGLRLTDGEYHTINADANLVNNQMKMKEALKIWLRRNPLSATFRNLLEPLLILSEGDVALNISQFIKDRRRATSL